MPDSENPTLPTVDVEGSAATMRTFGFPATVTTISADQIAVSANTVGGVDSAKYLLKLLVRKRNYADTQPVLAAHP